MSLAQPWIDHHGEDRGTYRRDPGPDGYSLLPGVLHAYRVLASDLPAYVPPDGDDD